MTELDNSHTPLGRKERELSQRLTLSWDKAIGDTSDKAKPEYRTLVACKKDV
jgi:hypothetical protein